MSRKKWTSNASWSKHPDTQDTHESKKGAEGVCRLLMSDYIPCAPCKLRGVCLKAWVEGPTSINPELLS